MTATCLVLDYYDISRLTIVSADASSHRLGAVLLQEYDEDLKPIAYCSRSLNPAEKGYAQIKKEFSSISLCGCVKNFNATWWDFRMLKFSLTTNYLYHWWMTKMYMIHQWDVRVCWSVWCGSMWQQNTWKDGDMIVADALSWMPLASQLSTTDKEVTANVDEVRFCQLASDRNLDDIRRHTSKDPGLQSAIHYTLMGWPRQNDVVDIAQPYHHVRAELSVAHGLLLQGCRIVIPSKMRDEVLSGTHDGQQGITKCHEWAQQALWWPNLNDEIKTLIANCEHCTTFQSAQRHEPMMWTPLLEYPWQHVGADMLTINRKDYLLLMDYYSRYIELPHMPSTTTYAVIEKMKNIFARKGIPEELTSDNAAV